MNLIPYLSKVNILILEVVRKMMEILPTWLWGALSSKVRKSLRVSAQYPQFTAFSRIVVRETCAFPRWGGELGKRLVHFIMAGHGGRYCEKSAGKWQLALAQGPELKSPSASRQISSAYWYLNIKWKDERPQNRYEDHVAQVHARCQLTAKGR